MARTDRVTYTIRWSRIKTLSRHLKIIGGFQRDVLAKTPGLHQVPKLRNLNLIFLDILDDGGRDDGRPSDLYYPLVADKNIKKKFYDYKNFSNCRELQCGFKNVKHMQK